jgi:hypothetical protein
MLTLDSGSLPLKILTKIAVLAAKDMSLVG